MKQITKNIPDYFLITNNYTIGTSKAVHSSESTIDIKFEDLAQNYDLQSKLKLGSAALIQPNMKHPIACPMQGEKLLKSVAGYLSAFSSDQTEQNEKRDYLLNNGLVRILFKNDELLKEVKKLI